jgi:AraC-like DNA-binding protein/ligand-binding sensor protein
MELEANLLDMHAEFSESVTNTPHMSRDELAGVLGAFEAASGLKVCIRTMSARWRDADGTDIVPELYAMHRSPFCKAAKARDRPACVKCDLSDLPGDCSSPQGRLVDPFVRTCQAGIDEILLPLWSEGMLVAVLFLGQFRRPADQRDITDVASLTDADIRHLATLVLPLRSYLLDLLTRLDARRRGPVHGRRGTIDTYLRESLSTGPNLGDLAEQLSVSRSRASHLVLELTGRTFRELVEERRISVAKDRLANSEGTVAWVARQTGFSDTGYFCRYFKRKTDMTPTEFRTRYSRVVSP